MQDIERLIAVKLGKVVGNVWATKKDEALSGYKLLIVKIFNSELVAAGEPLVAVDVIGAGIGETVIVSQGGSAARRLLGKNVDAPIDAAVVGIVDAIEKEE